jgi:hypothetical protein
LPVLLPKPEINHPGDRSDLVGESTIQAVLPTEEDQALLLHPGEVVYPYNVHHNITQNPNIKYLRRQFSYFEALYPDSYLIRNISGKIKKILILLGLHNHYYRAS